LHAKKRFSYLFIALILLSHCVFLMLYSSCLHETTLHVESPKPKSKGDKTPKSGDRPDTAASGKRSGKGAKSADGKKDGKKAGRSHVAFELRKL